jgi:protein-disulfide isomerase
MHHRIKIGLVSHYRRGLLHAWQRHVHGRAQTEGWRGVSSRLKNVKNYLLNYPEVLQRRSLERKVEQARVDATRAHLPAFHKSLAALEPDIAAMSVGKGDVTVVEFFDYNCGYCRKTLADLVKLMESDPNIKVQFLEYPILAAESKDAARVALAAGKQGKYFEFHKAMFAAGRASKDSALKVRQPA